MDIKDFEGTEPEFLPEEFLNGHLEGWGVLESVIGSLQKRFTVAAQGEWKPEQKVVSFVETWTFDDGRTDTLNWRINKLANGRYSGTETRIDGEANGEQAGCAFHWTYTRDTPQGDGKSTTLNFNDWFYQIDEKTAIVRGSAGRAGLPFAVAHVTYRKLDSADRR